MDTALWSVANFSYELDASGTRLREGSNTEFAQQALKDMVKTPEDLRAYWTNRRERKLLIEQLASEVVGLDALAAAPHLPDVDHYDLLRTSCFSKHPSHASHVSSACAQRIAHFSSALSTIHWQKNC